ncbi:hypothetical protein D3C85_1509920 [compost metagenome]
MLLFEEEAEGSPDVNAGVALTNPSSLLKVFLPASFFLSRNAFSPAAVVRIRGCEVGTLLSRVDTDGTEKDSLSASMRNFRTSLQSDHPSVL